MYNTNNALMKKLMLFVYLLCAFALGGCEDWVQDRRYPWQMQHGTGGGAAIADSSANDPCDEEPQASDDAVLSETAPVPLPLIDAGKALASADGAAIEDSAQDDAASKPGAKAQAEAADDTAVHTAVDASVNVDASLTGKKVVFDLPQSWSRPESESEDRAILNRPSADLLKPEVLLQAYVSKLQGTEEDARNYAEADYNERLKNCEGNECFNTYYQMKYIGGTKIYISAGVNTYWGNDSASCIIWFEKSGTVYRLDLDDKIEAQTAAVKQVIETIRLN